MFSFVEHPKHRYFIHYIRIEPVCSIHFAVLNNSVCYSGDSVMCVFVLYISRKNVCFSHRQKPLPTGSPYLSDSVLLLYNRIVTFSDDCCSRFTTKDLVKISQNESPESIPCRGMLSFSLTNRRYFFAFFRRAGASTRRARSASLARQEREKKPACTPTSRMAREFHAYGVLFVKEKRDCLSAVF